LAHHQTHLLGAARHGAEGAAAPPDPAVLGPWPAGVGLVARPPKTLLSLRIDRDVLDWFRVQGPGYQMRMHAVLRAYTEYARGDRSRGGPAVDRTAG
jgi:hypothetical protein